MILNIVHPKVSSGKSRYLLLCWRVQSEIEGRQTIAVKSLKIEGEQRSAWKTTMLPRLVPATISKVLGGIQ